MSRDVIIHYLSEMERLQASDLYLTVGAKPMIRIGGNTTPLAHDVLNEHNLRALLPAVLDGKQLDVFAEDLEFNTALDLGGKGRFRVNILMQKGKPALVIRRIVTKIPQFNALRLPPIYADLAMEKRGLILVAGMTGSGKSTSLASMIDYRNRHETGHIVTIEDPIEYYHEHIQSIVTQREVGVDTHSYRTALKSSLRQRPDVILIGEIRDREVMEHALSCAETGHLCLATVHSNNAYQAIERVVNFFPEEQAPQVRSSLASNLKAVLSQRLVPTIQGGLVPALEILLNQALIRELISKGQTQKIVEAIEKNAVTGMCSYDISLLGLVRDKIITIETAIEYADRPSELKVKIQPELLAKQEAEHLSENDFKHFSDNSDKENDKHEDTLLSHIDTSSLSLHD